MYLNLKLCIFRSGIRQNQLAQVVRIDEALLSKIIHGFREPTSEQRKAIANTLQEDEEWLFTRYENAKFGERKIGSSKLRPA